VITRSIDVRNVTPCSLVDDCHRFVGTFCLHLEGIIDLTATIKETEGSSETAVTIYLASHLKRHYSKSEYLFHRQCSIGDQHHSEGSQSTVASWMSSEVPFGRKCPRSESCYNTKLGHLASQLFWEFTVHWFTNHINGLAFCFRATVISRNNSWTLQFTAGASHIVSVFGN